MNRLPPDGRLSDLLVAQATEGLCAWQERELAFLLQTSRIADAETIELAAAAVDVALTANQIVPMPQQVRSRLLKTYQTHFLDHTQGERRG